MIRLLCSLPLLFGSVFAYADWELNNEQSTLSFISIKQADVAETHGFASLSGSIGDKGNATLTIDLDSVETGVPLRDERMREMLFDTEKYGNTATFATQINAKQLAGLSTGTSLRETVQGELTLHGQTKSITADLLVTKLDDDTVQVVTREPITLNAADYHLAEGVEALRAIMFLSQISLAVPVTFVLTFDAT